MKRFIASIAVFLAAINGISAANTIDLRTITQGKYSAKAVSGITPVRASSRYTRLSDDKKQIVACSFRTGLQEAVLFDMDKTKGERIEKFDGYQLSPDGKQILLRTHTKAIYRRSYTAEHYVYTVKTKQLRRLSLHGAQQSALWSDDSRMIAFVRENNIYLVDLSNDFAETQVTTDGERNSIINGIPDWVNEEEFGLSTAMVFNADGTSLCWVKYDESRVPMVSLQMFKGADPAFDEYETYPGIYEYKYPKAGCTNATVSAWSYDICTQQTRKLAVPLDSSDYIPRIKQIPGSQNVMVYTMNRHQDELNLYSVNPQTTVAALVIKEQSDCYIQESAMAATTIGHDYILLPSDRNGYMALYLYDHSGQQQRRIDAGEHDIKQVYGMDEKTGDVYYQAATPTAQDRQIYVSHKDGTTECITPQCGTNNAVFSADFKYFIHTWSDLHTPTVTAVNSHKGKIIRCVEDNKALIEKRDSLALGRAEHFSFTTSEGIVLTGWVVYPHDFDANNKYPVILYQYSGPGSQQVLNSWNAGFLGTGCSYEHYLASRGFIVVCVDGRGTGGRGAAFEKCTYQRLGLLEAQDQVETAMYLSTLPYVDKDAIGIWGWSFGGFCTLMSMSEGRPVFKAGVAVAPPTDFRYYDTIYTERFMRTPQENGEGYSDNAITRADKLHGALLLCHGMMDDNVHPQNTFEYTEALVQADKDFREIIYTNRNHSIKGGNTRYHILRQVADFFNEHLKSIYK